MLSEPEFLDQFSLVVATQLDEATLAHLAALCLAKRLPLVVAQTCGLLGLFRVQATQHAIADAKHDPPLHELLLATPFPSLQAFADSVDLNALSSIDHAHVPFVVLLLKAAAAWKATHNSQLPRCVHACVYTLVVIVRSLTVNRYGSSTFPEKGAFKALIQSMAHGPLGHEVNFVEAADNAYRAYVAPVVPDEVACVLAAARQRPLDATTPEFWLLARALADFVDAHSGVLPVSGVVPDMTASTEMYVALQEVYVAKAREDAALVRTALRRHLATLELPADHIPDDRVDAFCKNAYNIGVRRLSG